MTTVSSGETRRTDTPTGSPRPRTTWLAQIFGRQPAGALFALPYVV